MPQVIPNSNHTLPIPHESSALRSPRDSDDAHRQWKRAKITNSQSESSKQAILALSRQVEKIRRRILGGSGASVPAGWYWDDGKKLYGDPTVNNYSKNQIVKILETDSIVTTGIVCAGSATAVKATAGKWVCLQNVSVLKNDGTDNPAYIPAIPAASGSLDPDNANNYWEFLTPSSICVNGATTAI